MEWIVGFGGLYLAAKLVQAEPKPNPRDTAANFSTAVRDDYEEDATTFVEGIPEQWADQIPVGDFIYWNGGPDEDRAVSYFNEYTWADNYSVPGFTRVQYQL